MPLPTLKIVAPHSSAISKSSDIPMETSFNPKLSDIFERAKNDSLVSLRSRFTPIVSNHNPPAIQFTQIDDNDISSDDRLYITGKSFVSFVWQGGDIETNASRLNYQYNVDGQWSEITNRNTKQHKNSFFTSR